MQLYWETGRTLAQKKVRMGFIAQYPQRFSKLKRRLFPNPIRSSTWIVIKDASPFGHVEMKIYNVLGGEIINTIITKKQQHFKPCSH